MLDNALHITELLPSFLAWVHGSIDNHATQFVEVIVWAEALTAVGAAYAKRMIPLRTMAMLANVLGVVAGIGSGNLATLAKHAVNFPLNAARLREMNRLIGKVRKASETDFELEWLKPFMHPRVLAAGSRVFSIGDEASEAFMLVEGRIEIPERSVAIEPGTIFGEMALFTASGRRTASAVCVDNVRLLVITYEQFEQLYFQNPEFGLYLVRLIVRRCDTGEGSEPMAPPADRTPGGTAARGDPSV
jgi:CRP/FNR family cyclic AMP-dependent transcriptional regulator